MDTTNTYLWKELSDNGTFALIRHAETHNVSLKDIDTKFVLSFYEEAMGWNNFIKDFLEKYNEVTIPSKSKKLIDELLEFNNIKGQNNEFYTLVCIFQHTYTSLRENPRNLRDSGMKEFQNESKDLKILLDIIHDNLNTIPPKVASISFKGKTTKTVTNFFIVNDILRLLAESYNLTLENFDSRKQELLKNTNNIKFELLDEFYKYYFSISLYKYISKSKKITSNLSNKYLKYVIQLLHISQIPIIKTHFEVPSTEVLNELYTPDEIKYLSGFIKRPKSFFIE